MLTSAEYGWISVYLFVSSDVYDSATDIVIRDRIVPFVKLCEERGWVSSWFFIRYIENGPHIRVRLFGSVAILERKVKPALERCLRTPVDQQRSQLSSVRAAESPAQSTDTADTVIRHSWIPYSPEVGRYGGSEGVAIAEEFFRHSSEFAAATLGCDEGIDRSPRLGRATLATLTVLHIFYDTRVAVAEIAHNLQHGYVYRFAKHEAARQELTAAFHRAYTDQAPSLCNYIEDAWRRLEAGAPLTDELDLFRGQMTAVRERLAASCAKGLITVKDEAVDYLGAVAAIVPSYVHMTNNRLGITVREEAYVSHVLYATLTSPHLQCQL